MMSQDRDELVQQMRAAANDRSHPLALPIISKGTLRLAADALEAANARADAAEAKVEAISQSLARNQYVPGDHPVMPWKDDRFFNEVRAALASEASS